MTRRQEPFPNYLRPVIPQIKWWITGFYQAAHELEEGSKEIARECEEGLRDPASADLAGALSAVKDRSETVGRLACALDRLVDDEDLTNLLPRALEASGATAQQSRTRQLRTRQPEKCHAERE